jgi:hypothetical protein
LPTLQPAFAATGGSSSDASPSRAGARPVATQPYRAGKKTAEFLFEIMDSGNTDRTSWKRHILQPELVIRETSLKPER